jgi:uncharacterized membrane protein required for colicin V production
LTQIAVGRDSNNRSRPLAGWNFPRAFSGPRLYLPDMLIWILALILVGIAGFCGYKLGAVRFGVSLIGLILAAALALPLGPLLKPLFTLAGVVHPVWLAVLPPLAAFLIIYAIFLGLSIFAHRKVELYYKYQADDVDRYKWERVNRAVGLWVGTMVGVVWLFLFGLVTYSLGYFTVQVSSDNTESTMVRLVSQAREDLQSTGLDKAVALFDPMPARYYEAADIVGLLYQNPVLRGRLSQYPPFLMLGERPEFQQMSTDAEFSSLLLSKGDAMAIWRHPNMQAVIQNRDILDELMHQEFSDLRTYLETGVSPRYEDEKILGKWELDSYATMAQERRKYPEMSSAQMRQLRTIMTEIMPAVSFTATTDKRAVLKADISERLVQMFNPTPPQPSSEVQADQSSQMDPAIAQRYGIAGRGRPAQAPQVQRQQPASAAKPKQIPYMLFSAEGVWERDGSRYQIQVRDERGQQQKLEVTADDDRLVIHSPVATLVFAKAD